MSFARNLIACLSSCSCLRSETARASARRAMPAMRQLTCVRSRSRLGSIMGTHRTHTCRFCVPGCYAGRITLTRRAYRAFRAIKSSELAEAAHRGRARSGLRISAAVFRSLVSCRVTHHQQRPVGSGGRESRSRSRLHHKRGRVTSPNLLADSYDPNTFAAMDQAFAATGACSLTQTGVPNDHTYRVH